jgi:uncharacterized protein YceK
MRKSVAPLALVLATLYLTLSVAAVACLFAHEGQARAAHHHTGAATHSSLCSWACHASPTVDLPTATSQLEPLQLVAMVQPVTASNPSSLSQQSAQSRAPPRS